MWIGEVAAEAGVNPQTLRYYERKGLLPRPPRRTSGYREYPEETVRVVRFVKRAQDLGFSLDEAAELLKLRHAGRGHRGRVREVASRKAREIEQKIARLDAMRQALVRLVETCEAGDTPECPILEAFERTLETEVGRES